VDYRHYDTKQCHKLFTTMFQDFVLFAYTLKENIMFGDELDRERKERLLVLSASICKLGDVFIKTGKSLILPAVKWVIFISELGLLL
jgi:hypothetical protein